MSQPEIGDERLLAYAAGELDAAQAAAVKARLAVSPEQAATVARYQAVRAILRRDDSVAPPATVLARARAIFPAATATGPVQWLGLTDAVRRVVAELTFDSGRGQAPALAGFRGGDPARHLVFEAEGTIVDLHLEPLADEDQRWLITGQVETGASAPGVVVGLIPELYDASAFAVTTDAHGGFHFTVAAGRYTILIRLPESVVVLPNLVIE